MEWKIDLHSEINNIKNFKSLLEKYKDYNSCIRDIKINTLLGEKCLFEIEDINPGIYCDFSDGSDTLTSLNTSAIYINKLSFKINTDLTILEFKVNYKILDTKMGKLVKELQSFGISLEITPRILKMGLDNQLQVVGFYIDNKSTSTYIRA
jgi:hypothetical protein